MNDVERRQKMNDLIRQSVIAKMAGNEPEVKRLADEIEDLLPEPTRSCSRVLRKFRRPTELPSMTEYRVEVLLSMCPPDLRPFWEKVADMAHQLVHAIEGRCTYAEDEEDPEEELDLDGIPGFVKDMKES
jgi:hypothetical protein